MPFFLDQNFFENQNGFFSAFSAFCEDFQKDEDILNLINPYSQEKSILPKVVFFLKKNKYILNSFSRKKFFCFFFQQKKKKKKNIEEYLTFLKKQSDSCETNLCLAKNFFENEFLSKFQNFSSSEEITQFVAKTGSRPTVNVDHYLIFFIRKGYPIGVSYLEMKDFLYHTKIREIKGKGLFSPLFLVFLEKRNLIETKKWKCWDTWVTNKKFLPKKLLPSGKKGLNLIPCINCPVHYECHPQGIINPFDCVFLESWESNINFIQKIKK